jgi:hypothetical protein
MTVKKFILKNLILALSVALPLSAGINFVQQNNTTSAPSGLSMVVAYPTAQTAGNLNIVVVGWNDTSAAVKSITDTRGNSYTLAVGPSTGTALTQSIYYAKNIVGGSNTVTVTFNRTAAYPDVRVLEYAGIDPTNPLDVTAAAAGNSRNGSSGSAATTGFNELIFGAGMTFDVYSAAGSGFTKRVITKFGDIAEDATVFNSGVYSATAPLRASAPWVMQMAAFRATAPNQVPNPAPTVTAITPSTGPVDGGTPVTIMGTGFLTGATVSLGGAAATAVTVVSGTSITATTPANAVGVVNVAVTNTDSQSATLTGGYTYTSSTTSGGGTGSGISFVQVKAGVATSGSSLAVAYPAAQTAGNLNVIAVMWGDTTSNVNSVTDSRGNSYALAVGPTRTSGLTSAIYYAKNIAGGGNTVTVTFNQRAGWPNVNVLEYSGLDTANPLDVVATASGNGTIANSGAASTTSANELIVGAGNPSTVFKTAGSGFNSRFINSFGGISEDAIVTNAGNYNATAVMTSGAWVMQMAAFRAAQSSSGPPPPPPGPPRTYATNFPLAESSISEGGNWTGGGTTGLDWTDMQTTPGFAFATQTGNNPALFDDSVAVLAGSWAQNQSAQGTVQIVTPLTVHPGPCYEESEIFLRASISPHSITGYEINVGDWNTANSYIHVVRWNGSFGNYTTILSATGSQYGVKTGDIISAQIAGNVITVFINGVQKGQVTDSTYTSGSPGMGMYIQSPSACGSGNNNFGFSSYTATED